jgi:pyruvate dehydrogenase phosphatase
VTNNFFPLAIGDFSFKFHKSFLTHLFVHLETTASQLFIPGVTKNSRSPPYLIAKPAVKYVDLQLYRNRNPIVLLFSDGVDGLVSGTFVFHPSSPSDEEPSNVVGALLADKIPPSVESILGPGVESRWRGCDGNRAIEVLGNLLGGTDFRRVSMTLDPERLSNADDAEFYIDDTSIIVWDVFKATASH